MKMGFKTYVLASLFLCTALQAVVGEHGTPKENGVGTNHTTETIIAAEKDSARQLQGITVALSRDKFFSTLTNGGYAPTVLHPNQIKAGALLLNGAPAYDVFVCQHYGSNQDFIDRVGDYVAAGGNIVTEYDGAIHFFSSIDQDIDDPFNAYTQLGLFAGEIGGGYHRTYNPSSGYPINIVDTTHPTVENLANPLISRNSGTRYTFWVKNPDTALSLVATYPKEEPNHPNDPNKVLLAGCHGSSTFVFAMWNYQDVITHPQEGQNKLFFLNAVRYAATNTCIQPHNDPTLDIMGVPNSGQPVNTELTLSAICGEGLGSIQVNIDFGDGSTISTTCSSSSTATQVSHTYASSDVYIMEARATDEDGCSSGTKKMLVPVCDPSQGFVTGSGWTNSPRGALAGNPQAAGKAKFNFLTKYKNGGAGAPIIGRTSFRFRAGNFRFQANSYDWLVVAEGGTKAMFKGKGKVAGRSGWCDFSLALQDGGSGVGSLHITITDGSDVVYDNMRGTVGANSYDGAKIGGGNVKIHTKSDSGSSDSGSRSRLRR